MDITFFFNRMMISLTDVDSSLSPWAFNCLQGKVKEICITSHFLCFSIQLFHSRKDSKPTILYATASGALFNSSYQFALINTRGRKIGKLAAQHFCSLKFLSQ